MGIWAWGRPAQTYGGCRPPLITGMKRLHLHLLLEPSSEIGFNFAFLVNPISPMTEVINIPGKRLTDAAIWITFLFKTLKSLCGMEGVDRTRDGLVDISGGSTDNFYCSWAGVTPFEGKPYKGLKGLVPYGNAVVNTTVLADSPIKSLLLCKERGRKRKRGAKPLLDAPMR